MKSDDNVLGKGIEAIFEKTAHLRKGEAKALELPNGTIRREGDELIITLIIGDDEDIRGAVEELAGAADSGMLDQLVDVDKIKSKLTEHVEMAQMAADEGDLDSAVSEYNAALKILDNPDIRFNLAVAYEDFKKIPLAAKQYRQVLKSHPKHVRSQVNLALIYYKKGDLTRAMECYQSALNINPGLSELGEPGDLFPPRFPAKKLDV